MSTGETTRPFEEFVRSSAGGCQKAQGGQENTNGCGSQNNGEQTVTSQSSN